MFSSAGWAYEDAEKHHRLLSWLMTSLKTKFVDYWRVRLPCLQIVWEYGGSKTISEFLERFWNRNVRLPVHRGSDRDVTCCGGIRFLVIFRAGQSEFFDWYVRTASIKIHSEKRINFSSIASSWRKQIMTGGLMFSCSIVWSQLFYKSEMSSYTYIFGELEHLPSIHDLCCE